MHLVRVIQRPGFLIIPVIPPDSLLYAFNVELFEAEVGEQELIFVFCLNMIFN